MFCEHFHLLDIFLWQIKLESTKLADFTYHTCSIWVVMSAFARQDQWSYHGFQLITCKPAILERVLSEIQIIVKNKAKWQCPGFGLVLQRGGLHVIH